MIHSIKVALFQAQLRVIVGGVGLLVQLEGRGVRLLGQGLVVGSFFKLDA